MNLPPWWLPIVMAEMDDDRYFAQPVFVITPSDLPRHEAAIVHIGWARS
jgi:hypothetical protein